MPFFSGRINRFEIKYCGSLNTSLQVRIPCICASDDLTCKKRAFPSVSVSLRRILCARRKGGLTVEAAFCLSLMVFAMVILMVPMKIMNTGRQMQARLENVNEELCRYAYVKYRLEQHDEGAVSGLETPAPELAGMVLGGAAIGYAQSRLLSGADTDRIRNVSMERSSVLEDGETIDLIFDYEIELPFPILAVSRLPQSVRSSRRAWIGRGGGGLGGGEGEALDDPAVYVGKGSTRYHQSRSCHYLSNQFESVNRAEADTVRSLSGGRYYPCDLCGAGDSQYVYIMPNGSRYHSQTQCRSIVAYVRSVRRSEVVHMGGCSYCVN